METCGRSAVRPSHARFHGSSKGWLFSYVKNCLSQVHVKALKVHELDGRRDVTRIVATSSIHLDRAARVAGEAFAFDEPDYAPSPSPAGAASYGSLSDLPRSVCFTSSCDRVFDFSPLSQRWTIASRALPKTRSVNAMTAPAKVRNQAPRPGGDSEGGGDDHGRCGREAMDLQLVLFPHDDAGTEKTEPGEDALNHAARRILLKMKVAVARPDQHDHRRTQRDETEGAHADRLVVKVAIEADRHAGQHRRHEP